MVPPFVKQKKPGTEQTNRFVGSVIVTILLLTVGQSPSYGVLFFNQHSEVPRPPEKSSLVLLSASSHISLSTLLLKSYHAYR